jgi:uncharacterized protein
MVLVAVHVLDGAFAAAAVDFLATQPDVRDGAIGGLGLSVGGETLLQTAAEHPSLAAVVSEGVSIRSVGETLASWEPADLLDVPVWFGTTVATAVFSGELPPPALQDLVSDLGDPPVLLIHAGVLPIGGEELNPVYERASGGTAERWSIPDAGHTGGLRTHPDRPAVAPVHSPDLRRLPPSERKRSMRRGSRRRLLPPSG